MVTNGTLTSEMFCGSGPASTTSGTTLFAACVGFTITVAVPDLVESCVEVAVTVTFVGEDTIGAVSSPEDETCPALVLQLTLKFPVPMTAAEHWLVWPDWTVVGEHVTVTELIVDAGFTVTVAVPDFEASCVEVAVIVTRSEVFPPLGAVYKPEDEIDPAPRWLAVHVTAELKLPVPITVAEH